MNIWKRVSLSAAGSVAAIALLFFTLSTASAAGAGAISFTQTFHNAVQSIPSANPCTGSSM
jgi:hypothetical protein